MGGIGHSLSRSVRRAAATARFCPTTCHTGPRHIRSGPQQLCRSFARMPGEPLAITVHSGRRYWCSAAPITGRTCPPPTRFAACALPHPENVDAITRGPITIGHDVWVGARAMILSGVTHRRMARSSAPGAVVTRDIAPYSVNTGVPARQSRMRFRSGAGGRAQGNRMVELARRANRLSTWICSTKMSMRSSRRHGQLTP